MGITIDGDDVKEVTIGGDFVKEITVDGDVVFRYKLVTPDVFLNDTGSESVEFTVRNEDTNLSAELFADEGDSTPNTSHGELSKDGDAGSAESIVFDGLNPDTEYTFYFQLRRDDVVEDSSLVSETATTDEPDYNVVYNVKDKDNLTSNESYWRDRMEAVDGAYVEVISDDDLPDYDFSDAKVLVVRNDDGDYTPHPESSTIESLDIAVVSFSRYLSRNSFDLGGSSGTSDDDTWTVLEDGHAFVGDRTGSFSVYSSDETCEALYNLSDDVIPIAENANATDRYTLLEKSGDNDYRKVHFGAFESYPESDLRSVFMNIIEELLENPKLEYEWAYHTYSSSEPSTDYEVDWQGDRDSTLDELESQHPAKDNIGKNARSDNGTDWEIYDVEQV